MRGFDKLAEAVGNLRDRVQAVGRRGFALGTLDTVVECIAGLERHRALADSPLAQAIDRGLAEAADAESALPAVAAKLLSGHVAGMEVCSGGERLRGALLRCLAASCEGRRAYRAAEMELRAVIGAVDSETWRRGHGGAGTTLGAACGMLAELTPAGAAKREAEAAAFARAVRTVGPAAAVVARAEAALVDAVGAVSDEPAAAEEITVEVRRRLPGEGPYYPEGAPRHSDNTGWKPLTHEGLYDWEQDR